MLKSQQWRNSNGIVESVGVCFWMFSECVCGETTTDKAIKHTSSSILTQSWILLSVDWEIDCAQMDLLIVVFCVFVICALLSNAQYYDAGDYYGDYGDYNQQYGDYYGDYYQQAGDYYGDYYQQADDYYQQADYYQVGDYYQQADYYQPNDYYYYQQQVDYDYLQRLKDAETERIQREWAEADKARRAWTEAQRWGQAQRLYEKGGYTQEQIAQMMGVSQSTVSKHFRKKYY